jgi:hypothetical protein
MPPPPPPSQPFHAPFLYLSAVYPSPPPPPTTRIAACFFSDSVSLFWTTPICTRAFLGHSSFFQNLNPRLFPGLSINLPSPSIYIASLSRAPFPVFLSSSFLEFPCYFLLVPLPFLHPPVPTLSHLFPAYYSSIEPLPLLFPAVPSFSQSSIPPSQPFCRSLLLARASVFFLLYICLFIICNFLFTLIQEFL